MLIRLSPGYMVLRPRRPYTSCLHLLQTLSLDKLITNISLTVIHRHEISDNLISTSNATVHNYVQYGVNNTTLILIPHIGIVLISQIYLDELVTHFCNYYLY
jgi:hypothetical protein